MHPPFHKGHLAVLEQALKDDRNVIVGAGPALMPFKFHDFGPRGVKTDDTFLLGDTAYDGEHQVFLSLEMTPEQVERKVREAMGAALARPAPREGMIIKNFAPTRTPLAARREPGQSGVPGARPW